MQNNGYIPENDDAYLLGSEDNMTITMIGERQKLIGIGHISTE